MSSRVAMIAQPGYDERTLVPAIVRAIGSVGFDLDSVRGRRVLLKPNMLGAYLPSMGVTTNPAFVSAAAKIFCGAGAIVSIGDSPNGIFPIDKVWEVTGMREVCRASGAAELHFEATGSVRKDGLKIARAAFDTDVVVNLPKFKTHGLTILSLAAKNLFGCVNGMQKTAHHRECQTREEFGRLVARIAGAVNPPLTLIDGIVAMEGNGPSAGELMDLGVIVAGTDVHAVDAACCRLVGLPPIELDSLAAAKQLGLWNGREPLEISGDPIDELAPKEFKLPSTYTRGMRDWWISKFVIGRIWNGLSSQPVIDPALCKRCLLCIDACPVEAISDTSSDLAPEIAEKICIQCMCCHEVCPHKAIGLKESALLRLGRWLSKRQTAKHLSSKEL
ncbi:MAG: DUF362 domain-containing protein [Pseudomonadota bacterium]